MRLPVRVLVTTVVPLVLLVAAAPAVALPVTGTARGAEDFESTGCGTTAARVLRLPTGTTHAPGGEAPAVGTVLRDDDGPVATIDRIDSTRVSGRNAVQFTARGSHDACAPDAGSNFFWSTDFVQLSARFRGNARVFFGGIETIRYRPRTLVYSPRGVVRRVRWRTYNGLVAIGRGVERGRPVTVRLSRPRLCPNQRGEYQYFGFRRTYVGSPPPRARRTVSLRYDREFAADCAPSFG